MSFSELGLAAELLRAVETQGYAQPTDIQRQAIPPVLAGRDLLASARTGTGKTAAFVLPLLHRFEARARERRDRRPVVLILTPTRELAAQIADNAGAYGRHLKIRTTTIYGGVSIRPQIDVLRQGVDFVVATPGRLLDHMNQRTIDLGAIETVVLDEADRMLDMGFIRDIRKILGRLPRERQTLMFSATFSKEIRELAEDFLHDPLEVAAAPRNAAAERVEQTVYPVEKSRKRELLSWLIGNGNWRQVLVFTRTKHGADRLARQLEQDGLRAAAIHGNKSQNARTRALAEFKAGTTRVLVATDIAARGLDIERLPHVVNYEMPSVPEDYVHRIGRTARAGEDGQAISLVAADERKQLAAIEKLLRLEIRREQLAGYAEARPDRERQAEGRQQQSQGRRQQSGPRQRPAHERRDGGARQAAGTGGEAGSGGARSGNGRSGGGRPEGGRPGGGRPEGGRAGSGRRRNSRGRSGIKMRSN